VRLAFYLLFPPFFRFPSRHDGRPRPRRSHTASFGGWATASRCAHAAPGCRYRVHRLSHISFPGSIKSGPPLLPLLSRPPPHQNFPLSPLTKHATRPAAPDGPHAPAAAVAPKNRHAGRCDLRPPAVSSTAHSTRTVAAMSALLLLAARPVAGTVALVSVVMLPTTVLASVSEAHKTVAEDAAKAGGADDRGNAVSPQPDGAVGTRPPLWRHVTGRLPYGACCACTWPLVPLVTAGTGSTRRSLVLPNS